jgi:hypothetical protein
VFPSDGLSLQEVNVMLRFSLRAVAALGVLVLLATAPAWAQTYYVPAAPTVTYYYPSVAPVTYYTPAVSYYAAPAVSYYSAPTVAYYPAPAVSYYAAPAVSYYTPSVSYSTYSYGILPRRRAVVSNYYYTPTVVYPAYVP